MPRSQDLWRQGSSECVVLCTKHVTQLVNQHMCSVLHTRRTQIGSLADM